jgi:hypothetical protein
MIRTRQWWVWLLIGVLLAWFTFVTFRGYLNPDFLIGFANVFSC